MTTTTYFRLAQTAAPYRYSSGTNSAKLDTTTAGWEPMSLVTTRGAAQTSATGDTVAGTTLGVEVYSAAASTPIHWISAPLDADVTISGTITFNLWAFELTMNANVAINAVIDRIGSTGAIVSQVVKTARTTEVAVGTAAVNNFTATPTSTAFNKGDRIRVRVFGDDAGTMGAADGFEFDFDGPTGAANGDSFVTFTETFGFLTTDPTTTTVYPRSANPSPLIDPTSDLDLDMWTSRGASNGDVTVSSVNGWTAPLQVGTLSSGVPHSYWTRPLTAFTLAGPVLANLRGLESSASANASLRAELSVCDSDGTNPVLWAGTTHPTELTTSDAAYTLYLAGDDVAVTNGQRLRLRVFADDSSTAAMATGFDITFSKGAASAGVAGDTYLTFGQTLTEYVAPSGRGVPPRSLSQAIKRASVW